MPRPTKLRPEVGRAPRTAARERPSPPMAATAWKPLMSIIQAPPDVPGTRYHYIRVHMHITTSLSGGRLRNTSLPLKNGLLPVFEAVSNSIHAIEDAGIPMEQGKITLEIIREDQLPIDTGQANAPITKFRITDNGVGFTGDNFQSFLTLDSQYKATRGGRGVGRLLWLKAFERATIESTFRDDEGNLSCRHFSFHSQGGVSETTPPCPSSDETQTCVELQYF